MPWQMQINLRTEDGKSHWRSVGMVGHPPYKYDTKEEAQHILEICYPINAATTALIARTPEHGRLR